ncbi:MAG: patatin-like protein, partial [Steroidobacter sp.]
MNAATTANQNSVPYDPVLETRLAVVIYGGVSLAIYISGLVQEMLNLVRATAPDGSRQPLVGTPAGTEKAYRKLSQLLGNSGASRSDLWQQICDGAPLPIRSRFVIDVLSGTSAGGINAIFLAKALVNNQSLRDLKDLWITEGDIEKLINDRKSLTPGMQRQLPPQSLLNSNRMYVKLLDALDGMEHAQPNGTTPLVDHLDLYSTATDIHGLELPIALADRVVTERRHRNVFHFSFAAHSSKPKNAFKADKNPFLAFAARCTSSFPFAFEPMTLDDIFPILRRSKRHRSEPYCDPSKKYWREFYADYDHGFGNGHTAEAFDQRPFGDGGYLDNKPFSYAIDTMLSRQSTLPLNRKLIYIEPNPEESAVADLSRPDAIENSLAALVGLPRYETIRQDLEQVIARNVQIERVNRVVRDVESLLDGPVSGQEPQQWQEQKVDRYGPGYATYERLKVSTVTDELADLICTELGLVKKSNDGLALRTLAGVWRGEVYTDLLGRRQFLMDFDVQFRLRRIRHVWLKINDRVAAKVEFDDYHQELRRLSTALFAPYCKLQELLEPPVIGDLDLLEGMLPCQERKFIANAGELDVQPDPEKYPHWSEHSQDGRSDRARYVLIERKRAQGLAKIAELLVARFRPVCKQASEDIRAAFSDDEQLASGVRLARSEVRDDYKNFEKYDSAQFPITFGSCIGEKDLIDIHRMSPLDANARQSEMPMGKSKLRGTAFGAFGAFLDEKWRLNDVLWGRLDGAERLITMLMPEQDAQSKAIRQELIDEAHEAIVDELLGCQGTKAWRERLRDFLCSVDNEPQPELMARSAARATAVVGDLLDGIAGAKKRPGAMVYRSITMVGRLAWHLVEVSVPRTWRELFGTYWLQLMFLFAMVLLAIIAVFRHDLWQLGASVLAATLMLMCVRQLLRRYMRHERPWHPAATAALTGGAIGTLSIVIYFVPQIIKMASAGSTPVIGSMQSLWTQWLDKLSAGNYDWHIQSFMWASVAATLVAAVRYAFVSAKVDASGLWKLAFAGRKQLQNAVAGLGPSSRK